jgi:hypothetical protein
MFSEIRDEMRFGRMQGREAELDERACRAADAACPLPDPDLVAP